MMKLTVAFGLSLLMTGTYFGDDSAAFKITTRRPDDQVEVKCINNKVVFVVRSPAGISSATIERMTELWPDTIVIHLKLKGLEGFKLSTEKLKLEASVSSQDGESRLWKDGKEDVLLNPTNPSWMEIRIKNADGKPTKIVPLKDGCFEIQLPKMFSEDNPKTLTLNWIDFYRN